MTDAPKTMQLTPADWRQLCLLNVEQLHSAISGISAQTEKGESALTDEHMALIDAHVARGRAMLTAWRKSRAPMVAAPEPARVEQKVPFMNGAEKPKGRGGWPKGRPRKPRKSEQVTQ